MIFVQFFEPKSSTFTYLLASAPGREAALIDPVYEHAERYLEACRRLDLRLVKAIDTHVHADHVTALGVLRDRTRCVTVMGERSAADVVSIRVREGETIGVDGVELSVLYTPGHTDDSYSFVAGDRVFTGDALLIGGTGRTDFQNGDAHAAYHSLFDKLLKLPDHTLVFPAHDYRGNVVSTIATERSTNPRLQVESAAEYAEIMNGLNLPDPKMMDVAIPANTSIGLPADSLADDKQLAASDALRAKDNKLFVDLREPTERRRDGWIPGSLHVPYTELDTSLRPGGALRHALETRRDDIVLYCAFAERSALALTTLAEQSIDGPQHLQGGLGAWIQAGGPVEAG